MGKKTEVYCKECKQMIDITEMPFVTYADETPIILDMQLTAPATERKAINLLKKQGIWDFSAWGDGEEKLHHYSRDPSLSHMEPGDDGHQLDVVGGFWSPE